VAIGGASYFLMSKNDSPLLGGDSDKHGCKGSAGYSWCEVKNKCLRQWEEKCEQENSQNQLLNDVNDEKITAWDTYNNDEYGFEIKYPSSLKATISSPSHISLANKNCSIECGSINIAITGREEKSFQDIKKEAEKTWSLLFQRDVTLKETTIDGKQAYITPSYEFNLGGVTVVGENYIYNIIRSYSDKDISEQLFNQIISTFKLL